MLPTPPDGAASLADVLKDSLRAVRAEHGVLGLHQVGRAVVVLVDGLGAEALRARSGHARTLAAAMATRADVIATGVPTTTAAAIATLTTGARPGEHGIVGYTVLDPERDRIVKQLQGWDEDMRPETWQRRDTLFEEADRDGLRAVAIGLEKYRDSGFTRAVLRGAEYIGAKGIADRFAALGRLLDDRSWRGIAYVYVAELDQAGHEFGVGSDRWAAALESVDSAVRRIVEELDARTGLIVTADHGMLDIPEPGRLVVPDGSPLWLGVRHVAGEHRMLHLHAEPGIAPAEIASRWHEAEDARAWVATRDEAIGAGWFGPVVPEVAPRIGDVLVAPRKAIAYYTEAQFAGRASKMVGQHGSWTDTETRVPLLRFGAFA